MSCFNISIAGTTIGIQAVYETTKAFFYDYLSDSEPEFSVTVSEEDIKNERLLDKEEGSPVVKFSDKYIETLAVLRKIANAAIDSDIVLFHGSVIAYKGNAYMFTAPSGTGKTTHTMLWLDLLPDAHVLNGDKPFLKIKDGAVYACGTPWRGKENLGCNEMLPLKAICCLERAKENSIESASFADVLVTILQQIYCPDEDLGIVKVMKLCKTLAENVSFYKLKCNMDPSAAVVSSSAMIVE